MRWQFFLGLGAAVEIQRRFRGILARSPSRSPVRSPLRIARTVSAPAVVQSTVVVVFPNEGVLITCQALVRGRRVRAASYRRSPPLWSVRKRARRCREEGDSVCHAGRALPEGASFSREWRAFGRCPRRVRCVESSTRLSPRAVRPWRLLTGSFAGPFETGEGLQPV